MEYFQENNPSFPDEICAAQDCHLPPYACDGISVAQGMPQPSSLSSSRKSVHANLLRRIQEQRSPVSPHNILVGVVVQHGRPNKLCSLCGSESLPPFLCKRRHLRCPTL